jgi:hypothetical protein
LQALFVSMAVADGASLLWMHETPASGRVNVDKTIERGIAHNAPLPAG